WLAHKGEIVGRLANVEPILDEQTYNAVQAKLAARRTGPQPSGAYRLTGALHCGNPERKRRGTLSGSNHWRTARPARRYICGLNGAVRGWGMTITAAPVEAIVRDAAVAAANDPDRLADVQGADTALDDEREKLAVFLDALDEDIAATEAKAK